MSIITVIQIDQIQLSALWLKIEMVGLAQPDLNGKVSAKGSGTCKKMETLFCPTFFNTAYKVSERS